MTQTIYSAGLETQFKDANHLTYFITSQCTTETFANVGYCNSKLEFINGKLTKFELIDADLANKILSLQSE